MQNLFSLAGRTALVTGGSRGIGRMIAEGFVAYGAKVYVSSRNAEDCAATAEALSRSGTCLALPQDVSTPEGCQALAAALGEREKSLDILVNNAGAAWGAGFAEFPEKGWDKVMDLNLKAPFFLTQALHPLLKAAAAPDRPAKVINITSIEGVTVSPHSAFPYGASKAGLIQLTRTLAARLARDHIAVSAIAPGYFPSKMNTDARDAPEETARQIPIGRVGDGLDMAGAAVFLASRAGDYVVGETLAVDGGVAYASRLPHSAN
ncbi:MAG: dehydrogenase with different specificity (related to short-chain alcohol dehydrogenase)-like [Phenylobacterium sp.]|nr:dehydrogenase with different specificity (related to short-chain alcohol dehydrogenase)-like [Phenylobacterium sp.]